MYCVSSVSNELFYLTNVIIRLDYEEDIDYMASLKTCRYNMQSSQRSCQQQQWLKCSTHVLCIIIITRSIWYQHTLSINYVDRLLCLVWVGAKVTGGTWSKSDNVFLCWWTGNGFVKKSARLCCPLRRTTWNWPRRMRSRIEWNFMSMLFVHLGLTVSVAMPCAHLLSQRIVVGGCENPSARNRSLA